MIVKKEMCLLDFLLQSYNRKNAKNLLKYQQVYVNSKPIARFDHPLKVNDVVEIKKKETTPLDIIYEDQDLIVINKPSGLLSMSDGKEKEKTAYHWVSEYLKKQDKRNKVFIVHRLDRETSGVLMFCKNEKIRDLLQNQWNDLVFERGYMAVVEGQMKKQQGTLKNQLAQSKSQVVYVTNEDKGKLAITHYRVLKQNHYASLLEIHLDTGRKNQIRVQLSHIGHPIVGDKKYGAKTNTFQRLALHAHQFGFLHPYTHQKYLFEAKTPFSLMAIKNKSGK